MFFLENLCKNVLRFPKPKWHPLRSLKVAILGGVCCKCFQNFMLFLGENSENKVVAEIQADIDAKEEEVELKEVAAMDAVNEESKVNWKINSRQIQHHPLPQLVSSFENIEWHPNLGET